MKTATKNLLLIAGAVWGIAGANIVLIGIACYFEDWGPAVLALIAGSLAVFTLFHLKVFNKMASKHAARIRAFAEEKVPVWKFFDAKSYVIMAVMMGGGMALRFSGLVPDWFIASFYTGLGAALFIAGISFIVRFRNNSAAPCPVLSVH